MAEADSKPISILVFVMMDGDPYRLISANSNDTIKSVHYQIREVFGIPLTLQKIYYFGKRLEWCQTLKECSIKNYACLQVVLRKDGVTRQNSSEALNLVSQIHAMCQRKSVAFDYGCISNKIRDLFSILRQQTTFLLVTLPSSFVTLYENIEEIGDAVIRFFLDSLLKMMLAKGWLDKCASILTRLCVYLRSYHGDGNHLYLLCRTHLRELFEKGKYKINFEYLEDPITSILFIFRELAENLSRDLDRRATPSSGVIDVRHFKAFSLVLCNTIHLRVDSALQYYLRFEPTFSDLLSKTEAYLAHFENFSYMESAYCGYSQYLTILKALHVISKLCKSGEERFWNVLRNKRRSLLELIAKCTDRTNDHLWLLERKDVMDSKYRMHLAMMMMTEIRIHDVELYEMLVWSEKLDANLYMAFKNQQITNREVQQYWLRQLCGAIFNPQKSLFLACPNDPKRFYPNPAIEPNTLDLECFKFVGKLVAIALMSEIQIGVAFAHVFLMQLAGRRKFSLEDVRDLDPSLHSWCKEIIDGEVIDSEVLEFPEALLGCQWSTELSYVNSKSSREAYVDHLIQHRFVASISEQVSFFMQGFDSVFGTSIGKLLSVKGLELEDLNESLCGYVITTTLQLDNKSNPLMSRFPKAWQFPKIHDAKLYEMLIVWSKNLSKNLYMQFKNQQVTDPGVLQHWLCKLCGAIFNPQNPLFLACPNDPNRFYPNHSIELEPFHFDCLEFVGKLVALALMYEVQVGVAFAHLFLLQLAGRRKISLEDVKEVDPYLYSWCNKFIDAELIDSEVLEFAEAELGCQWSTELSHVNSKRSREFYVDRLIQHRFVKSISNQLLFFRKGFDNVFVELHNSTRENF
ncbi:E3 ubiquitin-protein ligase UPL5-like [Hevea brasiliensis]|uniref:E3 ubiquitin-protein ligase UPL5-like n=1 Tax=Hevea brasiliensis TaxID=3981 RepID=UPI0025D6CFF2|nr:E3 ubiquitin-protein ligase UPL5-like [Hevea brasiliensis]